MPPSFLCTAAECRTVLVCAMFTYGLAALFYLASPQSLWCCLANASHATRRVTIHDPCDAAKCMPLNKQLTTTVCCAVRHRLRELSQVDAGARFFPQPNYAFPSLPVEPPVSAEHEYGCCVWTSVSRHADSEHCGLPRGSACLHLAPAVARLARSESGFLLLQVVVGGTILTLMCGSIVFFCLFPQFWDKLSPPAQALKDAHAENEANKKAEDGASGSSDMVEEYDDWGRKVVAPGETGL